MAKEIEIVLSKSEEYDGLSIEEIETLVKSKTSQKDYDYFNESDATDHQDFSTYDESVHGGFNFVNYYYSLTKYLKEETCYGIMKENTSFTEEGHLRLKYYFKYNEHCEFSKRYLDQNELIPLQQSFVEKLSSIGLVVISNTTTEVADIV